MRLNISFFFSSCSVQTLSKQTTQQQKEISYLTWLVEIWLCDLSYITNSNNNIIELNYKLKTKLEWIDEINLFFI